MAEQQEFATVETSTVASGRYGVDDLDARLLPSPLEPPIVRHLCTADLFGWVWILVFVAIAAEGFLFFQLVDEGFSLAAWARFLLPNVLVAPPALRRVARMIREGRNTLILKERTLRVVGPEVGEVEIDYRDIAGYWLRDKRFDWLRIRTKDGREIRVAGKGFISGGVPAEEVVRVLGRRVPAEAVQDRGPRPEEPLAARVWDYHGDLPAVEMEPGKRYRYLKGFPPKEAKRWNQVLVSMTMPFFISLSRGFQGGAVLKTLLVMLSLALWFAFIYVIDWAAWFLESASKDRFEWSPEGIWVTRGKRRWLVSHPRPATRFPHRSVLFGKPMLLYQCGLRSYLFDPRFVEEDD